MLDFRQFEEKRSFESFFVSPFADRFVVDCELGLEAIKEGFDVVRVSMVGRGSLGLLVAAGVAFEEVVLCFFLESFEDHLGVGFGFAHLVFEFKFELL